MNRIPVATDGNYIYDVEGGRLQLIDATDPTSPVSLGYFAYPRVQIYDGTVAVVDGLVHSGFSSNAGGGGLVLLRRSETLPRTRSYLPLVNETR